MKPNEMKNKTIHKANNDKDVKKTNKKKKQYNSKTPPILKTANIKTKNCEINYIKIKIKYNRL